MAHPNKPIEHGGVLRTQSNIHERDFLPPKLTAKPLFS